MNNLKNPALSITFWGAHSIGKSELLEYCTNTTSRKHSSPISTARYFQTQQRGHHFECWALNNDDMELLGPFIALNTRLMVLCHDVTNVNSLTQLQHLSDQRFLSCRSSILLSLQCQRKSFKDRECSQLYKAQQWSERLHMTHLGVSHDNAQLLKVKRQREHYKCSSLGPIHGLWLYLLNAMNKH